MTVIALSWLAISCSKPANLVGQIDGVWETEWEDYIGKGDVDEIRMKETLVIKPDKNNPRRGKFGQAFIGEVEYDDFEYEQTIDFQVAVSGTWKIVDDTDLQMSYDLESMNVSTGKSNVKIDCSDAVVDLLTGDLTSAVVGGLMSSEAQDKVNARINNSVSNQVKSFFKKYLRELKHNKKAMKDITIESDVMKCKINTGIFGRAAMYDRKATAVSLDNALNAKKSLKFYSKKR